jgi:ATP-binding cassette subfamily C (CFTR/MRP) protein 4
MISRTNSEERNSKLNLLLQNVSETESINSTATETEDSSFYLGYSTYISVYSGTIAGATIGSLVVAFTFFAYAKKIGINMHDRMFRSLVRAPIQFYDKNPSGEPSGLRPTSF